MMADSGTAALRRECEVLLPWHATEQLPQTEALRIDMLLARDLVLQRAYACIRDERAQIVAVNERLGRPSPRTLQSLFAAIDLETGAGGKTG